MSKIDVICDFSNKNLEEVPQNILDMCNLKMLYLEGNCLERLPDCFFEKLPKLTWLDLRNNKMKLLPKTIGQHLNLENLLLSNNLLVELPCELGLLPNLKTLLVSENPLLYPPKDVIEQGMTTICDFLRQDYEETQQKLLAKQQEIKQIPNIPKPKKITAKKVSVVELLRRKSRRGIKFRQSGTMPLIDVRSLSKIDDEESEIYKNPRLYKPVIKDHKIAAGHSRISVCSHYNSNKYVKKNNTLNTDRKISDNQLGEVWLTKLKELLMDQQKILQQEKNLKTLSSWRTEKKLERPRSNTNYVKKVPYDTDPDYDTMLSRQELSRQIDKMIKNSQKQPVQKVDVQQLIDEVVNQLKNLEVGCEEMRSPRTEIEQAGRQIQAILELHKKIAKAQTINNTS